VVVAFRVDNWNEPLLFPLDIENVPARFVVLKKAKKGKRLVLALSIWRREYEPYLAP
jgi:hypothetical protein